MKKPKVSLEDVLSYVEELEDFNDNELEKYQCMHINELSKIGQENLVITYKAAIIARVIANTFRSLVADKNKAEVKRAIKITEEVYTDFDDMWEDESEQA